MGSLENLYIFFSTTAETLLVWKPTDCITLVPFEKAKHVVFLLHIMEGQFMLSMSNFPSKYHFFWLFN